ncbi:MAG: hypothetical protein F4213_08470 [Boseongicola sp. SB0677_bin_26]|nr:hypothetical protein [Boseongicola sp. SB0665_bin_10]MYG26045.1 hypothetical protein [Boseongicola sp. SB0677_bin_26]
MQSLGKVRVRARAIGTSSAGQRTARSGRGLGLIEAILSVAVMSVLLVWVHAEVREWAVTGMVRNEARATAELARAGRTLMESESRTSTRWTHGPGTIEDIALADLSTVLSGVADDRTPARRDLSLHLWTLASGDVVIIARARGTTRFPRVPGAEDGVSSVGVLLESSSGVLDTEIRGPGANFDMAAVNAARAGFATINDLFAFDYVSKQTLCGVYLHRNDIPACPDANVMSVSLDMGGNDIMGAGTVTANRIAVDRFDGNLDVEGGLSLSGGLSVGGAMTVDTLEVGSSLVAGAMEISGDLNVSRDLTVNGAVTGSEVTIIGGADPGGTGTLPGRVVAFGEAVFDTARTDRLNVESLNVGEICDPTAPGTTECPRVNEMSVLNMGVTRLDVDQVAANRADFDEVFVDDITISTCSGAGCPP